MPWDAFVFFLSLFDGTFQPTVGEGVASVEIQVAFVGEEAATILWRYVSDSVCCDKCSREIHIVLPPRLKRNTLVQHYGELRWLADEHLEGVVLLVEGAQGNSVGVEVHGELQPVSSTFLRLHLLSRCITLLLQDKVSIFRCSE